MDDFSDIDSMLASGSAAPAPEQGSQAPTGSAQAATDDDFSDIDDLLGEAPLIDDLTGDPIPPEFSGFSPDTAINQSALSAWDRVKLSMGNRDGNIEYLKSKFKDVQPVSPDSDELAVQKDGKWYRVDPTSGDIRDPWELAKNYMNAPEELLGDVADLGPVGIGAAVMAAPAIASATAAGGAVAAAAAGGAAAAGIRTSLGRIAGTYDATPAEQLWDIGFETLLNAGGTKLMMGVKPTASKIADKLGPLAERFKDAVDEITPDGLKRVAAAAADTPKALMKKLFASFSVGEDNFDTMVQNPDKVKTLMKVMDGKSGKNLGLYHDEITNYQTGEVKKIAENSRGILSQIYGKMRDGILEKVDDNFATNLDDAVHSTYTTALSKGIGKLEVADKTLMGADAAEYVAKNGLKGADFKLLSQAEMGKMIQQGADLGDELGLLAQDREAYKLISGFYNRLGVFKGGDSVSGKAGAKRLLDFKKTATELSYDLANSEKALSTPGVKRILDESRLAVDKAIRGKLSDAGIGSAFDDMNATYNGLSKEFAPLLKANQQYAKTGDSKVFESLLNNFLAKPGKQVSKKMAVDAAIDAAEANGLTGLAKQMASSKLNVQVGEAAKAFNPMKNGGLKSAATNLGSASMIGYGALTGNMPLVGIGLAAKAVSSPATAASGAALTRSMAQAQQYLASRTPQQIAQIMENPQAIQQFTQGIIQATQAGQQMSGQLQSTMQNAGVGQ